MERAYQTAHPMGLTSREEMQDRWNDLLKKTGMTEKEAVELLRATLERQNSLMQRARDVMAAMELLDDPAFTPETLRANKEAMHALEDGASVGEVYRTYFLRVGKSYPMEESANLGLRGFSGDTLTPEEIERINSYVNASGNTYNLE